MAYYTDRNIHPAHDLHYGWTGWPKADSAFPKNQPSGLMEQLSDAFRANDGLELEDHTWGTRQVQLTFRALPGHAPVWIARRAKGRLDHALRGMGVSVSFSRKVGLRAFGHNRTSVVEAYVRDQLKHVDLADERYRQRLASVSIHRPGVDLSEPSVSSHGRYWYNLHLVLVVAGRYRIGNPPFLRELREGIIDQVALSGCELKRAAIMPDHLHLALRGSPHRSPTEIAVALQQATAEVARCRFWEEKFYVGTFGAYDCGAVEGSQGGVRQ